jgi:formamidopyrimidine-DNA glycosylase
VPEYPEMATYTRWMSERVTGLEIRDVIIEREKTINLATDEFRAKTTRQRIVNVSSRGKHLLLQLSSGYTGVVHLMLGGWIYHSLPDEAPERTKQVTMTFSERREQLYFINLRLGYFHILSPEELTAKLKPLGPEALDAGLTDIRFQELLKKSRGNLKAFFLDQKKIAGIGNAYSDEMCWEAEIRPDRTGSSLSPVEAHRLYTAMRSTLEKGVRLGGYMDHPFFPKDRLTGGMNDHFQVYDREEKPCPRCETQIESISLAGRTAHFCPGCQK